MKRKRGAESAVVKRQRLSSTRIAIYTDGSCKGNNRKNASFRRAGYGIYYGEGDSRNVSRRLRGLQTNNRAEMQAIIEACERHAARDRIQIFTDSQYCKNVITVWAEGWKRRGWKKSDGKAPLNLDMVKRIHALITTRMRHEPVFTWVKGHSASVGNSEADRLANEGARMAPRE